MVSLKDFLEREYEQVIGLEQRFHKEDDKKRTRNNWMRDYSRILYCSSFRRLQGKMQLIDIDGTQFHRNRLTHSLEVAQIARSIPGNLMKEIEKSGEEVAIYNNDDTYVVEAGSLSHDIGNPPFGHSGEKILNELSKDFGGFEGNAQTIRVLTKLEKKFAQFRGLNLTARTLFAVLKYFKMPEGGVNKKFIYQEDYQEIEEWVKNNQGGVNPQDFFRTIDVQIVDVSDEIAYAAHDLEDAFSKKIFSVEEFLFEFAKKVEKKELEFFEDIIEDARNTAGKCGESSSSEEFCAVFKKEITSNLVNNLICDLGVVELSENEKKKKGTLKMEELGFKNYKRVVDTIKTVTFEMINRKDNIVYYEKIGDKVIRGLFEMLTDEIFNHNHKLMPQEYRQQNDKSQRNAIDYISGMMDKYAINLYEKYMGKLDHLYAFDRNN